MPNATSKGTVTNTYKGSDNARGEFIHDKDENGRWMKSNNIRVIGPAGYVMKTSLTVKQVSGFGDAYPDLQFQPDSAYILSSTNTLDGNKDKGYPAGVAGFYKPKRAEVQLP